MIGMRSLFRGYIIKTWKGVNFSVTTYKNINKIVVRYCVLYYKLCWDNRNQSLHSETVQRERVLEWYSKVKAQVETKEPRQVKLFAMRNHIQVERCRMETVLQWIYNVLKMIKKVEKVPQNDIRRYFEFAES